MGDANRGPALGAFPKVELPHRYRNIILRVEAGSTLHGISVDVDEDDRDEVAVSVDPPGYVTGLAEFGVPKSFEYRTAAKGARSRPDDLDLTIHPLRKFAQLAASGNPTILQTFFVPAARRVSTELGDVLLGHRSAFLSRQAGARFAGYLAGQRTRLQFGITDRRGQRVDVDPARRRKYAAHMVRLGFQGVELLRYGLVKLPMEETAGRVVREVRTGERPEEWALRTAAESERAIWSYVSGDRRSPLADEPDRKRIDQLLHDLHVWAWEDPGQW